MLQFDQALGYGRYASGSNDTWNSLARAAAPSGCTISVENLGPAQPQFAGDHTVFRLLSRLPLGERTPVAGSGRYSSTVPFQSKTHCQSFATTAHPASVMT